MKHTLLLITLVAGIAAGTLHEVRSQAPAPSVAAQAGTPLDQLKVIRDQNSKLLEQQAATLQKLDELEKSSQSLKVLGRRS